MRSNVEWQQWGREDPLYGVLTLPGTAKGESKAWTDQSFYAHGEREWRTLLPEWQRFGLDTDVPVLEIGSGAGRMTRQLAKTFPQVWALDVSPDQLAYAKEHLADCSNVTFILGDGMHVRIHDQSVGAVLSLHVFQHFDDPMDSLAYWREIARVLVPGGTALIQLPIHHWPMAPKLSQRIYTLRRAVGHLVAERKRRRGVPFLRVVSYDADWLMDTLAGLGFARVELRCTYHQQDGSAYWAVFLER